MSFINSSFFIVFSHYFSFLAEGKECNYGFDYIITDFSVKSSNKTYLSNRLLKFSGKDYYTSLLAQVYFLYESNVLSSKQTHSIRSNASGFSFTKSFTADTAISEAASKG